MNLQERDGRVWIGFTWLSVRITGRFWSTR